MTLDKHTRKELHIPSLGMLSMLIGISLLLVFVIYELIESQSFPVSEVGSLVSSLILVACFTLGIVGIFKKKLILQQIAILIFSVFILVKSIFSIIEYSSLFIDIYRPTVIPLLLPYTLLPLVAVFDIVAALLYIIKRDERTCVLASFISRLIVVPLLAFSIFEFFLNLEVFVSGNLVKSLFLMFLALGEVFIELGEHFFFDYMGDVACETKEEYKLTKKASLFLVINVGVAYLVSSGFAYIEFTYDFAALFYISLFVSFTYVFLLIFSFFKPNFIRITFISAVINYIIQITLTILLYIHYEETNHLIIAIFATIVMLVLPLVSVFLYVLTNIQLVKEDSLEELE